MKEIIRIEGLRYRYPYSNEYTLKGVTLSIEAGEVVVITGPSGSGKSTLCLTLNGVIPHVIGGELDGRVIVDGLDTAQHGVPELASRVGLVFQSPDAQIFSTKVLSEVAFGPENLALPKEEIIKRVEGSLEIVGLKGYEDREPTKLSDGEKRLVTIASVIAMGPKILVLDEPTTGLDPISTRKVISVIKELNRRNKITFIIVEHREEVLKLAHKVVIMKDGKILSILPPRDLFKDYGLMKSAYIRVPEIIRLFHILREKGIYHSEVPTDLEEALRYITNIITSRKINPPILHRNTLSKEPIVQIEDLSCGYNERAVLSNVSFDIHEGEILAIVGRNGSGKSTLAKCIMGLLKPIRGRILIDGRDSRSMSVAEISSVISYVFQNPERQFFSISVEEEVAFGPKNLGLSGEEVKRRVRMALESVDLLRLKDKHPRSLSRGQMQKLAIAIALAMEPQVIILDEPTTGLDELAIDDVKRILTRLRESGRAVVLITHEMELVASLADRVIALGSGTLLYNGDVRGIFWDQLTMRKVGLSPPAIVDLLGMLPDPYPSIFMGIIRSEEVVSSLEGE